MSQGRRKAPKAKRCEYTREIEPGKFQTLLYLGNVHGKRKYYKIISHSLEEAQWHDQEAERQKQTGSWRARYSAEEERTKAPTAADALSVWGPVFERSPTSRREDPAASTMRERRSYINTVSHLLGDPSLSALAKDPKAPFETLRERYEQRGVQHATWRKALSRLNGLLQLAVRMGALADHPFMSQDEEWRAWVYSEFKRSSNERRSLRASDDAERASLIRRNIVKNTSLEIHDLRQLCRAALYAEHLRSPIAPRYFWLLRAMAFHALTGLRPQELLALALADVEMDEENAQLKVHVRFCVKMEGGPGENTWKKHGSHWSLSGRLKTKSSQRTIVAGQQAIRILKTHLACPHRIIAPTLFSESDVPTIPTQYRDRMQAQILPHLSINPSLIPLGLRHTYATLTLERGVPIKVISTDLGHTKVSTTMDYYLDYLPSHRASAARALEDGMNEGPESTLRIA